MADKFQLKAIISAVDKITPTLKGVQRAARLTNKTLRDIGGAGGALMGSLGLPAGLAFGTVVYGAVRATSAVMNYAGSIQDASDRTGAGTTDYQVMANLLEAVGGSAEDAETAISKFNKGISNAASGADKSFAGLMQKLNIPLRDAKGNVRSLSEMMPELADAFEKNTNPTLRMRMSMELFGQSGSKLIPILTKGRTAYAEWAKEQERLGTIVGGKAIGDLDDLGDSVGVLNKQIKSQLTQSIASLVPVLMPVIKQMSEWIAANKEMIRTTVTKALADIVSALKEVDWAAFIGGIRDAISGVGRFIETMGGMKNVLIALGAIWLAGPVSSIFTLVGAFARLAMVALPVVAIAAAVAAAGYLIYSNWDRLAPSFAGVMAAVSSLGDALMGLWQVIGPVLMPVLKWVGTFLGVVLVAVIQGITDSITGMVGVLTLAVKMLGKLASFVLPDWVKSMFTGNGSSVSFTQQAAAPLRSSATALAGGRQQLNGEMTVRFENAPLGMRVEPGRTNQPGVSMNPDVGYRTVGTGFAG